MKSTSPSRIRVVLLGDRLLDLEHHVDATVGAPRLLGGVDDPGARRDVLVVARSTDPTPASFWITTSWPCATSSCTPIGVMATRYSWSLTSFGTPISTGPTLVPCYPGAGTQ